MVRPVEADELMHSCHQKRLGRVKTTMDVNDVSGTVPKVLGTRAACLASNFLTKGPICNA